MTLTLEQLRAEYTEEGALADILALFEAAEFEVGAWQAGAIRRSIFQALAKFVTIVWPAVDALSRIHFNSDSTGTALTHLSTENFGNTRIAALSTIGVVRLTGGAVGPPYAVAAGAVVVSDGTRTFRNTGAYYSGGVRIVGSATIPAGGFVDVEFSAEVPGAAGNVANNTITTMVTTYAGVTCNNPVFSGSTWITTNGADEESDAALQERNSAKVGTMSVLETIDDRYEYIARSVLANCRVWVDATNPRGPFTIDVWIAAADRVATPAERTAVEAAIAASGFGSLVATYCGVAHLIVPVGTVYYTGTLVTVQTAVSTKLTSYLGTAPIGGFDRSPGPAHIIPEDGLTGAIDSAAGVVGFAYTSGEATLDTNEVATLGSVAGLTYVQVTG